MSDTNTDRDPETLALFVEESLEGLQRVEKLLLDAERGIVKPDLMGVLFRDFHTIKGTSSFLDLTRILRLAHAAEDLLSHLRDKPDAARPLHFAHLVVVVDLLRKMIENVRDTNDEGDVKVEEIVRDLERDLQGEPVPKRNGTQRLAVIVGEAMPPAAPLRAPSGPLPFLVEPPHEDPPPPVEASAPRATDGADGTVRVSVGVLDRLMNLIGELVLARNQMVQMVKTVRDPNINAQAASQRLSLVTSDLQEQIMKTRMQPVARVFEKIPRMIRDLARETHKQVTVHVDGTTTEIDKALVEAIRDPVMHIVRNAVDHGIETPDVRIRAGKQPGGKLCVRAAHEGGTVVIEIEDDGRGIDPRAIKASAVRKGAITAAAAERMSDREALDLIFLPGFSTAEKVTDISGRGVGMDVVRTHVERAGGKVELDSVIGKGTTIRMKMPLTLAIIPALLVRTGEQRFAIPQVNLLELVYLEEEQAAATIEHVRGAAIYRLRGEILPLVDLGDVLKLPRERRRSGINIVVVAVGERRYGMVVDEIHDTEEIVIKPLHGQLKRLACYSGATVLGDGGVALILEVGGVAAMAGIDVSTRRAAEVAATSVRAARQQLIVFLAGNGAQCAVPLAMVARLENIDRASIERVAGAEVVQYRDVIMPIVRPETVLDLGVSAPQTEQPLVVFDFGHKVGMAVQRTVDIVDVELDLGAIEGRTEFTFGRAVILGRTTLLLDVYAIVRKLAPQFVQERRRTTRRPRVLLVDDSAAMRAALGGFLRASGMDIVDAATGEAALHELRNGRDRNFDAVVTDLEMSGMDGLGVIRAVRAEATPVPVFVWTYHDDPDLTEKVRAAGGHACVNKLHREQLVAALETAGILQSRRAADPARRSA